MVAISSNFFYTVTLPVTLWFLDKGKPQDRQNKVLFIDARNVFTQIDRAHREFNPSQLEFLSNIVRLYRGENIETHVGSQTILDKHFPDGIYQNVKGLCKVATLEEIEAQRWSLNPGRYVGVAEQAEDTLDFVQQIEELNEELEVLNSKAQELLERIAKNISVLLE